ncbi:hypothetical protein BY458DRAFT_506383 [Sporodiniella umbellata]|nr:hypothetical protein BY458DRAFT_506383 [Sporodiniella umbellata]
MLTFFQRCSKLAIDCVYTVLPSPKDLEYLQEIEYIEQIKHMEETMMSMEKEMSALKLAQQHSPPTPDLEQLDYYPSPVSFGSADFKPGSLYDSKMGSMYDLDHTHDWPVSEETNQKNKKRKFTVAKHNQIEATITEQDDPKKPWQLTLKNGGLIIDTHVNSYSDLLHNLSNMLTAQKQAEYALFYGLPEAYVTHSISNTLALFMWKKYGKSRFKSMVRMKPMFMRKLEAKQPVMVLSLDDMAAFTYRLVSAYIGCYHTLHFAIHSRAFIELFMSNAQNALRSPVVMALCSDICQKPCKHILDVISIDSAADYGLYYFEQARDLVSDRFDEVSLEILATYIFMTSYKFRSGDSQNTQKYLGMAEHMYGLLLPSYENTMNKGTASSEAKLFGRLTRLLSHIKYIQEMQTIVQNRTDKRQMIRKAMTFPNHSDHSLIYHTDESPKETRHVLLKNAIFHLRNSVKDAAQTAVGSDFDSYVGTFTHQIEMAIRYWYSHGLPKEYRLSLPLFEDIDDLDYFTVLERECPYDRPFGVLATVTAYTEFLVASQSFFPKGEEELGLKTEELLKMYYQHERDLPDIWNARKDLPRTTRLITKMKHIRSYHLKEMMASYDGDAEEYFRELVGAINPNTIQLDAPYLQAAIVAALNSVRLTQYLTHHEYSCFIEVPWIIHAWEILRRAAKLGHRLPSQTKVTLDRIKANMILCTGFLETIAASTHNDSAHKYVAIMREEFEALL